MKPAWRHTGSITPQDSEWSPPCPWLQEANDPLSVTIDGHKHESSFGYGNGLCSVLCFEFLSLIWMTLIHDTKNICWFCCCCSSQIFHYTNMQPFVHPHPSIKIHKSPGPSLGCPDTHRTEWYGRCSLFSTRLMASQMTKSLHFATGMAVPVALQQHRPLVVLAIMVCAQ